VTVTFWISARPTTLGTPRLKQATTAPGLGGPGRVADLVQRLPRVLGCHRLVTPGTILRSAFGRAKLKARGSGVASSRDLS
jgi:hypothetical protein